MEKKACALILTKIHCVSTTSEAGADDIFFEVYAGTERDGGGYDEVMLGRYFDQNPLHMKAKNDTDDAYIDISFNQDDVDTHTYIDYIRVFLYDNDDKNGWNGGEGGRDKIGDMKIWRDDPLEGSKNIDQGKQGYGAGEGEYDVFYRIIDKPIPTVRVFGIGCIEDSKGCNVGAVESLLAVTEQAAAEASEVIGKSPRPRAKAISKGFDVAAEVIGAATDLILWAIDAAEGKDEVYLQHVDRSSHDVQGGGWPQDGKPLKMEKGDELSLGENGTEYIRIPLDDGEVTLQLREQDPITADNCIGSFKIDDDYYEKNKDEGGMVVVADQYFRDQGNGEGQGAIYQLCISVGLENWAAPAIIDEQGDAKPEIGKTYVITNRYNPQVITVQSDGNIALGEFNDLDEQKWLLDDGGDGYFYLVNQKTKKVISPERDTSEDGANVIETVQREGSWAFEKWILDDGGEGSFYLKNYGSSRVLQLNDEDKDHNNGNIEQGEQRDQTWATQKWRFLLA